MLGHGEACSCGIARPSKDILRFGSGVDWIETWEAGVISPCQDGLRGRIGEYWLLSSKRTRLGLDLLYPGSRDDEAHKGSEESRGIQRKCRRGLAGRQESRNSFTVATTSTACGLSSTADQQRSINSQCLSSIARDVGRSGLSP